MVRPWRRCFRVAVLVLLDALAFLPALLTAVVGRVLPKKIDVGMGPEPMINYVYHKKALELHGYSAETFVCSVYHITDAFDIRLDLIFRPRWLTLLRFYCAFALAATRYRCLYLYFNGGPLGFTGWLWRIEPLLYRIAGVKVVVMAYGGDVQELSRSPNLLFKHAMSRDYPQHRVKRPRIASKIDLWTQRADHVIGGCEWVDYMYYWDTLMLAHFAIDTDKWRPEVAARAPAPGPEGPLRILHAPNHRQIKGTRYFADAVEQLKAEGLNVELVIVEGVPNTEIRQAMASADIVADQLVVGWYAMFALEAMAVETPVLCYLREDLEQFYVDAGLARPGEIPIVRCSPATVKEAIRRLALDARLRRDIGKRSRQFVIDHHSTQHVGRVFDRINRSLGLGGNRSQQEAH